jgi:hypothetical protein
MLLPAVASQINERGNEMEKLPFVLWVVLWPSMCQLCNLLYAHTKLIKYSKVKESEEEKRGNTVAATLDFVTWVGIAIILY